MPDMKIHYSSEEVGLRSWKYSTYKYSMKKINYAYCFKMVIGKKLCFGINQLSSTHAFVTYYQMT